MERTSRLAMTALIIGSGVVLGAQTPAQTPPPRSDTAATTATDARGGSSDQAFVVTAALAGMAEVEHGKLATGKAVNLKVKELGERMIADHTLAGNELKSLAASKQITLPAALDPPHQAAHDKYAKLSGGEFDRTYIQDMVADHQKAVADFTAEANNGKDSEVKAWASKTLPGLQAHLKMAQDLQRELGASPATAR
jgi:putative membrane protein